MHSIEVMQSLLIYEDMAFSCPVYLLTFCKHIVLVVLCSRMFILTDTVISTAKTVLFSGRGGTSEVEAEAVGSLSLSSATAAK